MERGEKVKGNKSKNWGRWSKNTKRFKTTWERLWDESGRWEWDEKWEEKKGESVEVADVEEVAEDKEEAEDEEVNEVDVKRAAMEREIREIEDAIEALKPYREPDMLENIWGEDMI